MTNMYALLTRTLRWLEAAGITQVYPSGRQLFEELRAALSRGPGPTEKCAKLEERLRQAERLASALRPFAKLADRLHPKLHDDDPLSSIPNVEDLLRFTTRGDLREARAALHGWDTEEVK